jgi:hypothetical protein
MTEKSEISPINETTLNPVADCLSIFDKALAEIQESGIGDFSEEGGGEFLINVSNLLYLQDYPSSYLTFLGAGAYKECYEAVDGWIIKFAGRLNPTNDERIILEAAEDFGLGAAFLKTIMIDLPLPLPLTEIGESYSDLYRHYEGNSFRVFNCDTTESMSHVAMLQPAIQTTSQRGFKKLRHQSKEYEATPLYYTDGRKVPFEVFDEIPATSHTWLQGFINYHGDRLFDTLSDFCKKFHLTDLHGENIGFLTRHSQDIPVILDCLSDSKKLDHYLIEKRARGGY